MTLQDHLPPHLRGPTTTITRVAAGLSGAGVYRVDAGGESFILKIAADNESPADWTRTLHIQRLAAEAGLTPRIVHVEELGRAVLTAFVEDRSFAAFYRDPRTADAALTLLGRTVRRLHALPLPTSPLPAHEAAPVRDPRELLAQLWNGALADFPVPDFARDAAQRMLATEPPHREGALVLGHNDLNPSNLIYDGEAILVLDWASAGPMDALYDLAVLSIFLRMDANTSRSLLSAYDGHPVERLPDRFIYTRRLAATLAAAFQFYLSRQMKHPGATGEETLETMLTLSAFYQQMRAGALTLGTKEGLWAFGLALLQEGLTL